jgi:hypothetical protein
MSDSEHKLWGSSPCNFLQSRVLSCRISHTQFGSHPARANAPTAVILFLAFNSNFRNNLVPWRVASSVFLLFINDVKLYFAQSLRTCRFFHVPSSCISLLMSSIKFCEWTDFLFLSTVFAHLSSPNSVWILSTLTRRRRIFLPANWT